MENWAWRMLRQAVRRGHNVARQMQVLRRDSLWGVAWGNPSLSAPLSKFGRNRPEMPSRRHPRGRAGEVAPRAL